MALAAALALMAVLALAEESAFAKCSSLYLKVFRVMGMALSGELSCMSTGLVLNVLLIIVNSLTTSDENS